MMTEGQEDLQCELWTQRRVERCEGESKTRCRSRWAGGARFQDARTGPIAQRAAELERGMDLK